MPELPVRAGEEDERRVKEKKKRGEGVEESVKSRGRRRSAERTVDRKQ